MNSAYGKTLKQLQSTDMSFQPLLPDDDYAIEQRLEALVAWVRGFLEGMALAPALPLARLRMRSRGAEHRSMYSWRRRFPWPGSG